MKTIFIYYLLFSIFFCSGTHAQSTTIYSAPSWSPSGDKFAYVLEDSGISDLYIFDLTIKKSTKIAISKGYVLTPAWSPDGKKIAYVSGDKEGYDIHVYFTETKIIKKITDSNLSSVAPSWFPDSMRIVYLQSNNKTKVRKIFTTNLKGDISKLMIDSLQNYIYPRISPNGKELLFASKSYKKGDTFHISIMNLESKKTKKLEELELVSYNPSWSYNGEKIVFVNQSNNNIEGASIFIMNKNGSGLEKIIDCDGGCFQPRFSPNGNQIVYKNGWIKNHKGIYLYNTQTKENIKIIGS